MTHDFHASDHVVAEGDRVYARNFAPRAEAKWLLGEVVQKTGSLSCQVQLQDGTVWRRHHDHIRKRFTEQSKEVTKLQCGNLEPAHHPKSPFGFHIARQTELFQQTCKYIQKTYKCTLHSTMNIPSP